MPYANIKFYEDHDGVAVILRDVLDTAAKENPREYRAISSKPIRKYLYKKFPSFTRQRIKKSIFVKVIAIGEGGEQVVTAKRKWIKTNSGPEPASYSLIYGNKFAMIALSEKLHPYGVVIEDDGVAAMQRLIFEQLWQNL